MKKKVLDGHHGLLGCLIAILGIAGTAAAQPLAPVIVIRGATLLDGNGGEPVDDATVVIAGGRIAAVGDASLSAPAGAVLIDARGQYLVPGLMDIRRSARRRQPPGRWDGHAGAEAHRRSSARSTSTSCSTGTRSSRRRSSG